MLDCRLFIYLLVFCVFLARFHICLHFTFLQHVSLYCTVSWWKCPPPFFSSIFHFLCFHFFNSWALRATIKTKKQTSLKKCLYLLKPGHTKSSLTTFLNYFDVEVSQGVSWLRLLSCEEIAVFLPSLVLIETPSNNILCFTRGLCSLITPVSVWNWSDSNMDLFKIRPAYSNIPSVSLSPYWSPTPPSSLRLITGRQRRGDDSVSCILHTDEM